MPTTVLCCCRPAIKPLWLSPVSAAARRSSEAPAAGPTTADSTTPASPKTATRLTPGSLDVVSLCSEDEVFCTPQPASAAGAGAAPAPPAASGGGAGAPDKEPDAGRGSQGGVVAAEGLQQLVELLAGQEVGGGSTHVQYSLNTWAGDRSSGEASPVLIRSPTRQRICMCV